MILDIIVVFIVIATMVQGYRHGLLHTFLNTLGWLIALGLGFILSPKINELILDNTNLYTTIYTKISSKTEGMLLPEQGQADISSFIYDPFLSLSNSVADGVTSFIITVLCFIIVTSLINLVFKVVLRTFSREHNNNILGFTDGAFGLVFGFVKGIIYVFICLACMFPLASLINTEVLNFLANSLHNSNFAMDLYKNNLVLLLFRDIF
ncbi:MAG: CvpA family protein [Aminipila sp.]